MRINFGKIIKKIAVRSKKTVVLTGDLGHGVFDNLPNVIGSRFINAGVAEHNMITLAAGMAYAGMKPWVYSIAPFVTIKVFEEIRNDISLPGNDVKIVGLGGGFDYAIAGPTHHVLQDVALLSSLQNFKVYTPSFSEDLEAIMRLMHREKTPSYLRLTKAEKFEYIIPAYSAVRRMLNGGKVTVIVLGSIINRVLPAYTELGKPKGIDLWLVSEIPFTVPIKLITSIKKTGKIVVVEEHVKSGGLGEYISHAVVSDPHFTKVSRGRRFTVDKFVHLYAKGYKSHRYGSRDFYLKENGLDRQSIKKALLKLIS